RKYPNPKHEIPKECPKPNDQCRGAVLPARSLGFGHWSFFGYLVLGYWSFHSSSAIGLPLFKTGCGRPLLSVNVTLVSMPRTAYSVASKSSGSTGRSFGRSPLPFVEP